MSARCSSNLNRALCVADYILEDGGHTIKEAAKEFSVGKTTIQRDINLLGEIGECDYHPKSKVAKIKCAKVLKVLSKLSKANSANNIQKYNLAKKGSL